MPAKIVILTGAKRGTEYLIQDDVVRIGSAANSQLQIPDLPPHAVTVRYSDGTYYVYNRTGGLIDLEGEDIAENGMSPWLNGQDLQLNQKTILQLRLVGAPAPQIIATADNAFHTGISLEVDEELPETVEPDLDDDETGSDAKSQEAEKARKFRNQLLLLGVLGVLFVGLVVLDSIKSKQPVKASVNVDVALSGLIRQLTDAIDENPDPKSQWKQFWSLTKKGLQDARISELRGNREKALEQYKILRQRLILHVNAFKSDPSKRAEETDFDPEAQTDFAQLRNAVDQFASDRIQAISVY